MIDELSNYFSREENIKRLIEDLKADHLVRDNLVNQLKDLDITLSSVSDDQRSITRQNIRDTTAALRDIEATITAKEKKLESFLSNTLTSNEITFY